MWLAATGAAWHETRARNSEVPTPAEAREIGLARWASQWERSSKSLYSKTWAGTFTGLITYVL